MLLRFSALRCREVINLCDGCRLGYVSDLDLDPECGRVQAIRVPIRGRFFGLLTSPGFYVIPWSCVRRLGEDLILVDVCLSEVRRGRERKSFL